MVLAFRYFCDNPMACAGIRPIAFVDQLSVIDRCYRSDEAAKGANNIRILRAQRRPANADLFSFRARHFAKNKNTRHCSQLLTLQGFQRAE